MSPAPSTDVAEAPRSIVDCWNRIGVHGDGSCAELAVHVHCRNCPVYSTAAGRVLDRDSNGGERREATRLFAMRKTGEQRAMHSAFLFRIAHEWLALPTTALDEVAGLRAVHSLPHRRSGVVLGLANVRGELLVCVSLGQLLGIEFAGDINALGQSRTAVRRLLVMRDGSNRLAFPVDEVHGTERFDDADLRPAPTTVAKAAASYTRALLGWREFSVGLLDQELLFHSLNRNLA